MAPISDAGATPERVELPPGRVDRSSPLPFYAQLADQLEQEILSGRWEPGARLPGELDLCAHFGLSRSPVRQALGRLEQRGLIDRQKGKGAFVQSTQLGAWLLQASEGFFQDEVHRLGRTVTSKLLRTERAILPPHAAEALELPPSSIGVVLERLRSIDGRIALYVINHLPERIGTAALTLADPLESLYSRIHSSFGIEAAGGRRRLQAVAAEGRVAEQLELPVGAPVAFIESVSWDANLQPFDFYQAWLRTDRVQIDIYVSGAAGVMLPLDLGRGETSSH